MPPSSRSSLGSLFGCSGGPSRAHTAHPAPLSQAHPRWERTPPRPAQAPAAILAAASVRISAPTGVPRPRHSPFLGPHLSKRPRGRSVVLEHAQNGHTPQVIHI
ncbi:hypothetical protein NDU88_005554 [Pleurodeles waltl]|uniref:Uncharacterized protein n=1 Tax=Pleurodeles waltl TaxID=8319 RepID=A0AAV7PIG5_PLEWA|nr:hypothetical protein NDU88_005554 [Pleurodeles waltl]